MTELNINFLLRRTFLGEVTTSVIGSGADVLLYCAVSDGKPLCATNFFYV